MTIDNRELQPSWVQASLWNFIKYNVVGGGDSALYGVESPTYYLRNGLLNLNLALPLALVTPPALLLWTARRPGSSWSNDLTFIHVHGMLRYLNFCIMKFDMVLIL